MLFEVFRGRRFDYRVYSEKAALALCPVDRRRCAMDDILARIPDVIDKATRGTLGLTVLTILVLGGAIYLLFGTPAEFMKLVIFSIIVTAYLSFLLVTGRL
jgi:hypothetical protein